MRFGRRSGGVVAWVLGLIVLLAIIGGGVAWWYLAPTPRVTSYLNVPRRPPSHVIDPPAVTDAEYRLRQGNHMALITSPLVLDAVLQQRDIANLDLIDRQADPLDWLADSLQVSFPADGEIMELSLPCADVDAEQCVKIVDAVANAYFDKVLLQRRLADASAQSDFRQSLKELDVRLKADLKEMETLKSAAVTPDEIAHVAILENDCEAKLALRRDLKVKELRLQLQQEVNDRSERHGGVVPSEVRVTQRAMWAPK